MTFMRQVRHDQDGTVTIWLIGIAAVATLMFALVADGSRILAAASDTSDIAQVAARTATRQVDPSTGRLDTLRATTAANAELADAGVTGSITVAATTVTVTASDTIDLPLLAAVGIPHHTVTTTRTARLLADTPGAP